LSVPRALANDPPLIVGDEPTGNLDSVSTGLMFALFEDLVAGKVPRVQEVRDGLLLETSKVDRRLMAKSG
jgi:ABC-type ATPase involved in cell division